MLLRQTAGLTASLKGAFERCPRDPDPSARTAQALFAFGGVLRHATAFLLAPLLVHPEEATDALRMLKRPTYGQLWAAATRLAAHPRLAGHPLADRVRTLDRRRAPRDLGGGPLVPRLLAVRNAIAHGSRVLAAHEWRAHEPSLMSSLNELLEHLSFEGCGEIDGRLLDTEPELAAVPGQLGPMMEAIRADRPPEVPTGEHCTRPYPCPYRTHCGLVPEAASPASVRNVPNGDKLVERARKLGIDDVRELPAELVRSPKHKAAVQALATGLPHVSSRLASAMRALPYALGFSTSRPTRRPCRITRERARCRPFQWSLHLRRG